MGKVSISDYYTFQLTHWEEKLCMVDDDTEQSLTSDQIPRHYLFI